MKLNVLKLFGTRLVSSRLTSRFNATVIRAKSNIIAIIGNSRSGLLPAFSIKGTCMKRKGQICTIFFGSFSENYFPTYPF